MQRNIWEISCRLRDLIIWSSYTPEELEQLARAVRTPLETCACIEKRVAVMIAVHRACSTENPFSRRIQRDLDARYKPALDWVAKTPVMVQFQISRGRLDDLPTDLPDLVWAVARDGREQLADTEITLSWRLMVEGARLFTFGQVEFIEVGGAPAS